ncbi:MAG: RNA 2',3'-cyclic phosphodiesterase [Bacteroidia bacterium]|nr:MAG: RNA 2',3'-cyclic phosphodiesterase [Bacteroidia bacterium]
MRLFVGLTCPPEATAWILKHKPPLLPPGARWVHPENWHVTLLFLGETAEERVQALHEGFTEILEGHPAFYLRPRQIAWHGRTLWVALHPSPYLLAVVERLHLAAGLPLRSPFRPHITLARSPKPLRWTGPPLQEEPLFLFTTAYLYRSHLSPAGATYEPLRRYLLDVTLPR